MFTSRSIKTIYNFPSPIPSAIAASKAFEPVITNLTSEGAATIENVAATDASAISFVEAACGCAMQSLARWLESMGCLCCAMGDGGGGGETGKTAFEIAKAGGKHHGWLKNYRNKSIKEIKSGIKSIKKQILKHQDCIKNPQKYYPGFYDLEPRHQKNLLNVKWAKDIARQREQLNILEGLLKTLEKGEKW